MHTFELFAEKIARINIIHQWVFTAKDINISYCYLRNKFYSTLTMSYHQQFFLNIRHLYGISWFNIKKSSYETRIIIEMICRDDILIIFFWHVLESRCWSTLF
jgi:hypothetical protein